MHLGPPPTPIPVRESSRSGLRFGVRRAARPRPAPRRRVTRAAKFRNEFAAHFFSPPIFDVALGRALGHSGACAAPESTGKLNQPTRKIRNRPSSGRRPIENEYSSAGPSARGLTLSTPKNKQHAHTHTPGSLSREREPTDTAATHMYFPRSCYAAEKHAVERTKSVSVNGSKWSFSVADAAAVVRAAAAARDDLFPNAPPT